MLYIRVSRVCNIVRFDDGCQEAVDLQVSLRKGQEEQKSSVVEGVASEDCELDPPAAFTFTVYHPEELLWFSLKDDSMLCRPQERHLGSASVTVRDLVERTIDARKTDITLANKKVVAEAWFSHVVDDEECALRLKKTGTSSPVSTGVAQSETTSLMEEAEKKDDCGPIDTRKDDSTIDTSRDGSVGERPSERMNLAGVDGCGAWDSVGALFVGVEGVEPAEGALALDEQCVVVVRCGYGDASMGNSLEFGPTDVRRGVLMTRKQMAILRMKCMAPRASVRELAALASWPVQDVEHFLHERECRKRHFGIEQARWVIVAKPVTVSVGLKKINDDAVEWVSVPWEQLMGVESVEFTVHGARAVWLRFAWRPLAAAA